MRDSCPYRVCHTQLYPVRRYGLPGAGPLNPIHLDSPPKPKRQRKAKDLDAPAPEKRGAVFKKKCPQNILDRVERVMSQRCV